MGPELIECPPPTDVDDLLALFGSADERPASSSSSSSTSSTASDGNQDGDSSGSDIPEVQPPKLRHGWSYFAVDGGHIVFGPNKEINGHCGNPLHGKCHWDKTTKWHKAKHRDLQGRPSGALKLWLFCSDVGSREEHQSLKHWASSAASKPDREWHRARLHELPGSDVLFDRERDKYDDTDSEPEYIPN